MLTLRLGDNAPAPPSLAFAANIAVASVRGQEQVCPIRPFREVFALKLEVARRFALSLPEAAEEPHFELSSFRVRGKIFATVPPDGKHLHIFVDEQQREPVVAANPAAFEKLWWGSKVVGVRVVLAKASRAVVSDLLYSAWCRKASKRLVASFVRESSS